MSWRKPVPVLDHDVISTHVPEEPKSKRQSWNFPWFAVEPQPPQLPDEWQEKIQRVHIEDEIRGGSKATRPTLVRHASTSAFIRPGTVAPRPNLSRRYVSASSLVPTVAQATYSSAPRSSAVPRPLLGRQTSGLSLASSGGSSLLTMASVNEAQIIARGQRRRGMIISSEYDAATYEEPDPSSTELAGDTDTQFDASQDKDSGGRTERPSTSDFGPRVSATSREPSPKEDVDEDTAARQPVRKQGWLRKLACRISCCGTSRHQLEA